MGNKFVPGSSCQCTSECKKYGNCCSDYDAHCSAATCASYGCEQFVSGRACQCTNTCKQHGNCCADYDAHCMVATTRPPKDCSSSSTEIEGFGMTADKLHAECKDTILMSRDDGDEVIVFEPERILSKKVLPFKCGWMCKGACQKEWPAYCH